MPSPPEPFRDLDLLAFTFVGDPQLSPDGRSVAFTRTVIHAKDNGYRSRIWVVPFDGSAPPAPLTSGPKRDTHPRYSPDGRWLAFLSDRDGPEGPEGDDGEPRLGAQIHVLPLAGGEGRRVTGVRGGIEEFTWSQDSARLAFVARIPPGGAEREGHGSRPAEGAGPDTPASLYAEHNRDVRYVTRLRYRLDGQGWFEDRRAHVFAIDVAACAACDPAALPAPLQVTSGPHDHRHPAWSPDGRLIAVSACRSPEADLALWSDIWLFPSDGSAVAQPGFEAPRGGAPGGGPADVPAAAASTAAPHTAPVRVTEGQGPFDQPAFSPSGRRLAFTGHARPRGIYSETRAWVVDLDGPRPSSMRCVTPGHPRSLGDQSLTDMRVGGGGCRPVWSGEERLYVLASDRGTSHLYSVEVGTGEVARVTSGDRVLFEASVAPRTGRAAFAAAAADHPNDIYVADLGQAGGALPALSDPAADGGVPLVRLTRCNEALLSRRRVALPERFTFGAENGAEVEGWVWRPPDLPVGGRCATVLEIHGGPAAMYTGTFFFEFQLLLSAGIGVVVTNPRGSQGYGEDFCAGIEGAWGRHDFADVMAGLDAALERFDWIDRDRLGVAGGSYGGYMTAWVIGHTSRFKAACAMRPVINGYSMYGSSDAGVRLGDEWWGRGVPPWEDPESYLRISPITYARQMSTPTLVIVSEQDFRCPPEQAEQLFVALRRRGVEAEFLRYPGESHGLSRGGKPWHRVHRLRHIVGWFAERL